MFDERTNNTKDIADTIRSAYRHSLRVFTTPISHSIWAEEFSASGQSILVYDPTAKVADSYIALAREVLHE